MSAHLAPDVVEQAQRGDEKARDTLLRALQPILYRFFRSRLGSKDGIDDLVQNTLVRVHTGLADLLDPAAFKAFAMKAAVFELHDFYRGRYRAKETLLDPDAPLPAGYESVPGAALDVSDALAALSPKARHIMELRAYGYRYEEIAQLVESSEAAIKMQVKRAIEKLRDTLLVVLLLWMPLAPAMDGG